MRRFDVLLLASLNRGKQDEYRDILRKHNLTLGVPEEYLRNFFFLDSVEDHAPHTTYFDNAKSKCMAAFQAAKLATFADDSGLEIDALQGQPGVKSAIFAAAKTGLSQNKANRQKVLELLKGNSNRAARFRCVIAFMVEGVLLKAEGTCEGKIATEEKGDGGFGYDSIFIPTAGDGRTLAQMSSEEKNAISHRHSAVLNLLRQMEERNIELVRP